MARKRQIDPKYPFKDEIASLSIEARYFYILSWCQMDDTNGVCPYAPKELKRQIFPDDPIDIDAIITELLNNKRLIYFESGGRGWLWCPSFKKHQIINHPSKGHYPDPPPELREDYRSTPVALPQSRISRISRISRVELVKRRQPSADFSETTLNLLKDVYKKGFNIYSFINRFKKERKYGLPEPVLVKVCEYYAANQDKIKKDWPWFITSVKQASMEYFASRQREEGEAFKRAPVAQAVKDILKDMASKS